MANPYIKLQSQKETTDFVLLGITIILVIFGLLMVYEASTLQGLRDFKDSYYYIKAQSIWVLIGFASLFFFSRFDYKKFKPASYILMAVSIILLLAVFVPAIGISGGGAHRWLKFGPVTFQPAEIVKLTGVIFLAMLFEKRIRLYPFAVLLVIVSVITAVLQRDLGSTIVFAATSAVIYWGAGGALWHFLIFFPVSFAAVLLMIITSPYRSRRILAFFDPFSDTQGYTYHISQVLIALGSGGFFGLGLGNSRQKFEYIPEVTTDSIFGVIGEELGFLGAIAVIFLFAFLIYRGLKISEKCTDNFGKILALGLTSWLGIQFVINISSMIALLPLTGVPLPFISYGGSALLVNLTAIGILINISRQSG